MALAAAPWPRWRVGPSNLPRPCAATLLSQRGRLAAHSYRTFLGFRADDAKGPVRPSKCQSNRWECRNVGLTGSHEGRNDILSRPERSVSAIKKDDPNPVSERPKRNIREAAPH